MPKHKLTYVEACHAMQSGVAMMLELGSNDATPKHLRVGVNSALISQGGLVNLLIRKGVFTLEEYEEAMTDFMNREVVDYEDRLSKLLGKKITLR